MSTERRMPRDPGLQPERTALAWQRTALALAVATLVIGRLAFGRLGALALLVAAVGLTHTATLFVTSRQAYRQRLRARQDSWPTGRHGALLVVQVAALGALELASTLAH